MIPNVSSRDERIAGFAKTEPGAGQADQTIAECDICGFLEWICNAPPAEGQEPRVHVKSREHGTCPRCNSVRMRSPEVFQWVLAALLKHETGGGHTA